MVSSGAVWAKLARVRIAGAASRAADEIKRLRRVNDKCGISFLHLFFVKVQRLPDRVEDESHDWSRVITIG
jgi:hypothetical protein